MFKEIAGGVCAAKDFYASGIHCGIRKNRSKRDLALIYSKTCAHAAAIYTQNRVQGAPIHVTKQHLNSGSAQALICNSGNANTCNANGIDVAEKMTAIAAEKLNINSRDVLVASTGVIGQELDLAPVYSGIDELVESLTTSAKGSSCAAQAIMTTDTTQKELAIEFELDGRICHMGAIAKGSGMIHPNMATMLVFITTDCAIGPDTIQCALKQDVKDSFNMISVDGDTSTNDMLILMANNQAGNKEIQTGSADYDIFCKALSYITTKLCKEIAADGEGATKLIECLVEEAQTDEQAKQMAKSVICSSLVKAAMFGEDANWGRILCAIGYSKAEVDIHAIDVLFESKAGSILVCQNGFGTSFNEDKAAQILAETEIVIRICLHAGHAQARAWGCDLTYNYVKINGDYRT